MKKKKKRELDEREERENIALKRIVKEENKSYSR